MMDAIRLKFTKTSRDLTGRSKWWGAPDLPEEIPCPYVIAEEDGDKWEEPLTFICQIRCSDIAALDKGGLLPHEGMLYFFAAIDEYLGEDSPIHSPIGEWDKAVTKVIYSKKEKGLSPYVLNWEGTEESVFRPAEEISFEPCAEFAEGFKLLGKPFFDEVREQYHDCISLLQLDEEEDWRLRFYDCGMLNILMPGKGFKGSDDIGCVTYMHSL